MNSFEDEESAQGDLILEIECVNDEEVVDDQHLDEEMILPFDDNFDKHEQKVELFNTDYIIMAGVKLEPPDEVATIKEENMTVVLNTPKVENAEIVAEPVNANDVIKQETYLLVKKENVVEEEIYAEQMDQVTKEPNQCAVVIDDDDNDEKTEDIIEVDEDGTIEIKLENGSDPYNKSKPYYVGTLKLMNNSTLNNFKVFCCSYCNHIATSLTNVMRHCRSHTTIRKRLYQCHSCDFKSPNLISCHNHVKKHNGHRCRKGCKDETEIAKHKRTQPDERRFICSICYLSTSSINNLNNHISHDHPTANPFYCHFCNFKTYNRGSFKKHLSIHGGQVPYTIENARPLKCSFCNIQFSRQCGLSRHMGMHYEEVVSNS